jgi:hypothetical protein
MVHGTPEGYSRWRFTDVYGERFELRARVECGKESGVG